MRAEFLQIAEGFRQATQEPLSKHPIARLITGAATDSVRAALSDKGDEFLVRGSPGQGHWAQVPWISVFDPAITTAATHGYYVVYLFAADMSCVYLSLNQGTTAVREDFRSAARDELERRARIMRTRLADRDARFTEAPIDLRTSGRLGQDYEAGHALGMAYDFPSLPDDTVLTRDLGDLVALYSQLIFRGGLDPSEELEMAKEEAGLSTIDEQRRYTYHRRIERNPKASREAKKVHGYKCQACGFDFQEAYGEVGAKYIEAHHLTPLSELPEDRPAALNPKEDFAVLCANCHRMIHKAGAPRTVAEFRTLVGLDSPLTYSDT